jgi:hypothetical protein
MAEFEEIVLCQHLLPVYAQLAQRINNEGGDSGRLSSCAPKFTVSL